MEGREPSWLHFDHESVVVEADAWTDLDRAVSAFNDLRHGQVLVQLRGPLSRQATDAATYLGQVLGGQVTVLESGADELLIARRPIRREPIGE